MKTEFELEYSVNSSYSINDIAGTISIVWKKPNHKPYVSIMRKNVAPMFMKDKDLERFAVNILKSLKSKMLKNYR